MTWAWPLRWVAGFCRDDGDWIIAHTHWNTISLCLDYWQQQFFTQVVLFVARSRSLDAHLSLGAFQWKQCSDVGSQRSSFCLISIEWCWEGLFHGGCLKTIICWSQNHKDKAELCREGLYNPDQWRNPQWDPMPISSIFSPGIIGSFLMLYNYTLWISSWKLVWQPLSFHSWAFHCCTCDLWL